MPKDPCWATRSYYRKNCGLQAGNEHTAHCLLIARKDTHKQGRQPGQSENRVVRRGLRQSTLYQDQVQQPSKEPPEPTRKLCRSSPSNRDQKRVKIKDRQEVKLAKGLDSMRPTAVYDHLTEQFGVHWQRRGCPERLSSGCKEAFGRFSPTDR